MDYYDFVASAIAAVASLYNANAELAHLQKIGVKDVCVLWCGSTLQNNKAWLSTTVPDCMYYEATYDGDKKELRLDAYRKIQSVSIWQPGISARCKWQCAQDAGRAHGCCRSSRRRTAR